MNEVKITAHDKSYLAVLLRIDKLTRERDVYKECLEFLLHDHVQIDKATVLIKTHEALRKGAEIENEK